MKQKFTFLPSDRLIDRGTHYESTSGYFARLSLALIEKESSIDYRTYLLGLMKDVRGVDCKVDEKDENTFCFTYSKGQEAPVYLGSVTLKESKNMSLAKEALEERRYFDVFCIPLKFSNHLIYLLLTQQIIEVEADFGALVEKEENLRKALREKEKENEKLTNEINKNMDYVLTVTNHGGTRELASPLNSQEAAEALEKLQMVLEGTPSEKNTTSPNQFFEKLAWKAIKQQLKFYGITIGANIVQSVAFFIGMVKFALAMLLLGSAPLEVLAISSVFVGIVLMLGIGCYLGQLGGSYPNPAGFGMAFNLFNLSKTIEQQALTAEDIPVSAKEGVHSETLTSTMIINTIGNWVSSLFHKITQSHSNTDSASTPSYEVKKEI